jgi:hypothetical protein
MKFTSITLSDFQGLAPFFKDQPHELCSYLLPSIIAWTGDNFEAFKAISGDDLIITARVMDRRCLFLPVAPMDHYPPERLRELAREVGIDTVFPVPDSYLVHHGMDAVAALFDIQEKSKHSDYIYRTEDLAQLKGNTYSKKRNLINQFKRRYVKEGRAETAPITPADIDACLEFLDEWCLANDCDAKEREELACEKEAAKYTLKHLDIFGSTGLLLRIDGEINAFGIGARLTREMGVLNFEKAFSDIKGLYQYFDRECARQLFQDYLYINKENDMGEPGLQKAKKSYYPVRMVTAYELVVKGT